MREDRETKPASACPPTGTEKMLRDLASVSGLVSVTLDGERIHDIVKLLDAERARIRALEEALDWYADQFCEFSRDFEGCGKMPDDNCVGCRARAAIAQTEEPKR